MAVPVLGVEPRNQAEPRWMTPRNPKRDTFGHQVIWIARQILRCDPDPWQQHWALVAGELIEDPDTGIVVPAYPVAMATVMRQQGKTNGWMLPAWVARATLWEAWDAAAQIITYTAQSGSLARLKFEQDQWPKLKRSPVMHEIDKPRFAAEKAGVDFKNGSHMTILSNSADAGHSLTLDMTAEDEIWVDTDRRRDQAADPAMLTRIDSQKIIASTAGTDASMLFLEKQGKGRAAVDAGRDSGMAYLEFSADPSEPGYDPTDPKVWRANMPAYHRLGERKVRALMEELTADDGDMSEWERAGLNVTQSKGRSASPVSPELWAGVQDHKLEAPPVGALVFGVEAKPDLAAASVVAVDDGLRCELVDHRHGVSWLVDYLDAACARSGGRVVVDVGGPLGYLADRLESRSVEVVRFGTQDVKHAAASFMDVLASASFRVRPSSVLDAAVEKARKRKIGDGWSWDRFADGDISPLAALTLGLHAQVTTDADVELYVSFD